MADRNTVTETKGKTMDNSDGYKVTFDGDMWHADGVQQADVVRLEYDGDVIATITYGPATRTYRILGVWPADENVIGEYDPTMTLYDDWRSAMRWIADLLSGNDHKEILTALERY